MPSPRIITVDPTGTLAHVVRVALDLIDRSVVQIDVSSGTDAIDELKRGGITLLITAVELDIDMKGIILAIRSCTEFKTPAIVIADVDDMEMDEETINESPFIYLQRPVDIPTFARVLMAGLMGEDLKTAVAAPAAEAVATALEIDYGPVPTMDTNQARKLIDRLMIDLGAQAVAISARTGEVIVKVGVSAINIDNFSRALIPQLKTNLDVKELVGGGQATSMQFFDGVEFDVFVLSVGVHHFMSITYKGSDGDKQLAQVRRWGRKCVEDVIALLGAHAWIMTKGEPAAATHKDTQEIPRRKPKRAQSYEPEFVPDIPLAKADLGIAKKEEAVAEAPKPMFDPIAEFDIDKLLSAAPSDNADDLFSMDNLEKLAQDSAPKKKGGLSWEEAQDIGVIN
jgi:hypothetical protein